MTNLILFTNSFLSYLFCFGVFVLAVVIAVFIGISLRKSKNAKLEAQSKTEKAEDSGIAS